MVGLALALFACAEPAAIPALPATAPLVLPDGAERRDVRFPCGDGVCAGWLYLPAGAARPPVVLLAHGLAGTRDAGLPFLAERFARDGLAALAIDYRNFGASSGAPRQLVDPWSQLEDLRAALLWLRSRPEVDGARVALFGTSLGGGHVLVTAAEDGHVQAVVAQVPLIDTSLEGEATFYGVGWVIRLLLTGWLDLLREGTVGRPIEIPAIAPAGGFGMIVDDAAYAAAARFETPDSRYRNAIVAHSAFTFDDYDPAPFARRIEAPVLLIASPRDRFAPFAAVEALGERPNVEITRIDGDHFDVYFSPVRERAAAAASGFLRRAFGAAPGAPAPPD